VSHRLLLQSADMHQTFLQGIITQTLQVVLFSSADNAAAGLTNVKHTSSYHLA